MIPSESADISNQQENEQAYVNEGKDPVHTSSEVAINSTSSISINITKVNCSSEKIYGPVEVLQIYKIT